MTTYSDGIPVSGGTGNLLITYLQLSEEVGDFLGIGRSSWSAIEQNRINSIIKSGLRQVYYPQEFKPGIVYQWSFMRPEATIETTAEYSTGTVEIVAGVVTLTTGTWPSWAAQGELTINTQVYAVDTRDSDTQITLEDLTVAAAASTSYSLGRPAYDLPEGFDGNFDGDLHYKLSNDSLWPPIKIITPEMLRINKQSYTRGGRPTTATIQPKTFDATIGQRWQIIFHPSPDAAYTLYGRYKLRPSMISGINLHPLGGTALSEVILESCLAVAEKRFVEDSKIHQEEFRRLILQAIANDAEAFSADNLGYNSDRSEGYGSFRRFDNAIHSVEGITYYDQNP